MKAIFFILVLVLLACDSSVSVGPQSSEGQIDSILKENKTILIEMIERTDKKSTWIDLLAEYLSGKKHGNTNPVHLVRAVTQLGLLSSESYTRFIEDSVVTRIMIDFLKIADTSVNVIAGSKILEHSKPDHIRFYSDLTKKNVNFDKFIKGEHLPSIVNMKILGLTKLSAEEKSNLLEKSFLPADTRAILGDTVAENYFIKRYLEEVSFNSRADLSEHLGYIGTPKTLKTLAASLDTQITKATASDSVSVRYYILKALSYRYAENPLLTSQLEREMDFQSSRAAFVDGNVSQDQKTYMQLVSQWVNEEFDLKIKPESNFLAKRKLTEFR
ncbi:MAG: hypothetical protein ACLFVQ_13630 [Chitinispirillaceae bacterium]